MQVIWLQTASGVADIRISSERPDLSARSGFSDCTIDELLALAEQDCFCATTLFDPFAEGYPMAIWPTSMDVVRFQSVVSYPEPGWLEWRNNGTVMIEYAPSGAYEEDWRLDEINPRVAVHLSSRTSDEVIECLYIVGDHAIRVRDRQRQINEKRPLAEIVKSVGNDLAQAIRILDCEFSYARRQPDGDDYKIELSTLPWLEGQVLDLSWAIKTTARQVVAQDPTGRHWRVESLWRAKAEASSGG